ncbi:MAG TPA: response regulator transcription factor [Noviherbaspirillum sp.]|nr:response regulator transcription factor [Noviherbaspirillum sp.]
MLGLADSEVLDVLLVDDHPVVRVGFATLLGQLHKTMCFYEAEDAVSALALATARRPRIALVDLSLAGVTSLGLVKDLHEAVPGMAILVTSMHDERLYAERALRAGARGYMMKHNASSSVVKAVETVCAGRIWLSDAMQTIVLGRLSPGTGETTSNALATLSDREIEVFQLIGMGQKKTEIAERLSLSPHTVETYRTQIKRKLGIASGAELYRMAFLHFSEQNPGAR